MVASSSSACLGTVVQGSYPRKARCFPSRWTHGHYFFLHYSATLIRLPIFLFIRLGYHRCRLEDCVLNRQTTSSERANYHLRWTCECWGVFLSPCERVRMLDMLSVINKPVTYPRLYATRRPVYVFGQWKIYGNYWMAKSVALTDGMQI
jgi:hypothetical protein